MCIQLVSVTDFFITVHFDYMLYNIKLTSVCQYYTLAKIKSTIIFIRVGTILDRIQVYFPGFKVLCTPEHRIGDFGDSPLSRVCAECIYLL